MPLLQQRLCLKCGKETLHEFVSKIPFKYSYWKCRECDEKRKFKKQIDINHFR